MPLFPPAHSIRLGPLPAHGLLAIGCATGGSAIGALGQDTFPVTIGLWAIATAMSAVGIIRSTIDARKGSLSAPILFASLVLNACAIVLVGTGIWHLMTFTAGVR